VLLLVWSNAATIVVTDVLHLTGMLALVASPASRQRGQPHQASRQEPVDGTARSRAELRC